MALILDGLTKTFQSFPAVNNLTCTFDTGVYGLLGVNGAGKTTLLRMLCTLLTPTAGSVTWEGQDIFTLGPAYRNLLGYLPQEFGFYPDFTVEDYLLYIACLKGLRPATAKRRTETLLRQGGLHPVRRQKMKRLSGGMKRRAGIAQAMLNDPKVLILDEPTAGLDPKERIRFRNLISELAEDRLVILSTHIVSDVEYIAGEILLLKEGTLVQQGAVPDLLAAAPTRVWTCLVPREAAHHFLTHHLVANVKTLPQGTQLRILSPTPPIPEAVPAEMTLEDLFLHHFGEKGGDGLAEI